MKNKGKSSQLEWFCSQPAPGRHARVSQEAWRRWMQGFLRHRQRVERGARNVSIDNMGLLADALQIPLKDLVDPGALRVLD